MKKLTIAKLMLVAAAWRPPPVLSGSDWADGYRVLPSSDAEPGPYRTDRFPLIREVQDVLADDETRTVVIWGPTQSAKTTAITNFLGRAIHHDPGRTLIVYPTEDKAKEFSIEKFEPMVLACPALREKHEIGTARTHRKSILDKSYPGMTVYMRGGNSENPYSSGSMRYAIADELDRIPRNKEGRPVDLLRQRVSTFANHKLLLVSTCTAEGSSEIAAEFEKSDQRKPYVPCLKCGHMHVMSARNIDYDGVADAEEASRRARYRCPECKHEHFDADKPAMLARHEWRKHNPSSSTAGFWWSAVYSPWVAFGQMAREYVSSSEDDDARRVYWNCRLAKLWKEKTEAPAASVLDACIDADRPRGSVPPEALLLTGGADVQKDVVYWVVRAWGPQGKSWLVNHGLTERANGQLDWLDDVFGTTYGGHDVRLAFIDSGWDEECVYDHCLARRNCHPSKGQPSDVSYEVEKSPQVREKGQYRGRNFYLWKVNSHKLRGHIHDRIALPVDAPRAWRLHADVDSEYKKHLLVRERRLKKQNARMVLEWTNPDKADHYADAEIYSLAAAKCEFIAPLLVGGVRRPAAQKQAVRGGDEQRRPGIRRSYG